MHLRHVLTAAILMASGLGSAGAASAATTLTAGTILQDFNAVVFTNGSTSADIEGAAVIGGNFKGASVYIKPATAQPSGFGALTVFGATSGGNINLNNGGDAYVAGKESAHINFNSGDGHKGGRYIGAPGATISDFVAPLTNLSTSLAALSATGSMPATRNNEVIKAVPNTAGIAVIDLTSSQLASIPSYKINLNGASTLIFNVSGSSIDFNANTNKTGADNIIWNFYQAKSVTLQDEIAGTVLAPDANVKNENAIDGALVAESWTGQGELHDYGFTGKLPPAVPEPSVWGMLIVGIGAVGAALRQRRSAAVAA